MHHTARANVITPAAPIEHLRARFAAEFRLPDDRIRVVRSPYRVCPIGAHIDHQGSPTLGMAISAETVLLFAPDPQPRLTLRSENFPEPAVETIDFAEPNGAPSEGWGGLARAAVASLADRLPIHPRGIFGLLWGSLPGSGLSSSASTILAYLNALAVVNDIELLPTDLVRLCSHAENSGRGLNNGILDQASIVGSRAGRLLHIDCRRTRWEAIAPGPRLEPCRILIAFSGQFRELIGTDYNNRVAECRDAAGRLAEMAGLEDAERLGDLAPEVIEAHYPQLPPPLDGRARHFIEETRRVSDGIDRWKAGDLVGFGKLMNESCLSSILHYQCSSSLIQDLHMMLIEMPEVVGCRFSGAGFGGSCVALVRSEGAEECCERARRRYVARHPKFTDKARFFLVDSVDGVHVA